MLSCEASPEMDTDVAAHPITNRQNHIEVIEIPLPFHLTCAFHLNCSEFPNSCFFIQLAVLIYMADVFTDRRFGNLVQLAHGSLRHPDRVFLKTDVNLRIAFFSLID